MLTDLGRGAHRAGLSPAQTECIEAALSETNRLLEEERLL